jgi:cell division protein FtsI (penicillin-binding protein 3)
MATHDHDPLLSTDRPDEAFEKSWRLAFRRRLLVVGIAFAVWTVGIQARLVYLQVVAHPAYLSQANDQHNRVFEPAPKRGDLLDRNGEVLAMSVDADTISVNPRALTNPAETIDTLCGVFGDCSKQERASLIKTISGSRNAFAFIRRGVSPNVGARVAALKLHGVEVRVESRRYYPNKELGAHMLGFVGRDNDGLGGIEQAYDSTIRGKKGRVLMLTDANSNTVQSRVELEPTAGASLELTIDQYLQHIAERELQEAGERHRPNSISLVALVPDTGEIVALANYPRFNPNTPALAEPERRRNRAVLDVYEPGSTFKMVTAAAAIEEGVLSASDMIDTSPGRIMVGARNINDDGRQYGLLSFEDVIVKSSNVGAVKAGWQIGAERLNRYVRRFGFGEIHAPDFRGVPRGKVWAPELLDASALASVSMGYQVSVTPLQMAAATAAVANGGMLFEPRLVRAIIRDGRREVIEPKPLRRAISPSTAAALTTIMEAVVERGTGKAAQVAGYQVAGKTGTTQKIVDGRYSTSHHIGSFTGFLPSRRPALVVLVVVDTPEIGGYYGGAVAAPIFQRFSEAALRHLGVAPTINPTTPLVVQTNAVVPVRYSGQADQAQRTAVSLGGALLMPDVTGLGARDATRVLTQLGLSVRPTGTGVVITQSPAAGEPIEVGGVSRLQLDRVHPARPAAGGGQ